LTNPVANVKMKAKVTKGNVDFVLSLGSTTGFVKEPKIIDVKYGEGGRITNLFLGIKGLSR